jgi:hypothetical protein
MEKSCFTCRYRGQPLNPDSWGNRPYVCSKRNVRLTWGQQDGCPDWKAKRTPEERMALAEAADRERAKVRARAALV